MIMMMKMLLCIVDVEGQWWGDGESEVRKDHNLNLAILMIIVCVTSLSDWIVKPTIQPTEIKKYNKYRSKGFG